MERHLILPQGEGVALTLWTIFTYCFDAFDVSPMLFFYSPLPECGKSRALTLVQYLSCRGLMASSISSAGFFRTIEALKPALFLDEIDTYLRERDELRGVINSGHSRTTAHVIRVDGESMEPRSYSTWCAKALAGIGLKSLADAPRSRSIKIEMQKKLPEQKVEPLRNRTLEAYQREVGPMCLRWTQDNMEVLSKVTPKLPSTLTDRAADNWEPLATIAEVIGGEWPVLLEGSIKALERSAPDDDDIKIRLLYDLRDLFAEYGSPLASKFVAEKLCEIEEAPWSAYGRSRKPISVNQLSSLLRPFGINSNTVWLVHKESGKDTAKGYKLEDCQPVFSRYLPPQGVRPSGPSNDAENRDFQSVRSQDDLTFQKCEISSNDAAPDALTFQKPPQAEKSSFGDDDTIVEYL
jgi:putative DNA primase/helicase